MNFQKMHMSLIIVALIFVYHADAIVKVGPWKMHAITDKNAYSLGMGHGDCNGDGFTDICQGNALFLNPGKVIDGVWIRLPLPSGDAVLIADINNDGRGELFAVKTKQLLMFTLKTDNKTFDSKVVATGLIEDHGSSEGAFAKDLFPGDNTLELIFSDGEDNIHIYDIFDNWKKIKVASGSSNEAVTFDDVDGDGLIDIAGPSDSPKNSVCWWKNPGRTGGENWQKEVIATLPGYTDRIKFGDCNKDGHKDLYCGVPYLPNKNDNNLFWIQKPSSSYKEKWIVHTVGFAGGAPHGGDILDINGDGYADLLSAATTDSKLLKLWINNGNATFTESTIQGTGDLHNSGLFLDLDKDGDFDIVGGSWELQRPLIFINGGSAAVSNLIVSRKVHGLQLLGAAKPRISLQGRTLSQFKLSKSVVVNKQEKKIVLSKKDNSPR